MEENSTRWLLQQVKILLDLHLELEMSFSGEYRTKYFKF
jgi:hypothetical protein